MKNDKNMRCLVAVVLCCFSCWFSTAQTDTLRKTQVEKMTIIGTVDPVITTVKKPEINPDTKEGAVTAPALNFEQQEVKPVAASNPQKSFPFEQLAKNQQINNYKRNYVILGLANYWTPLAEFYADINLNKQHALGLHLKHLSSQGGIKNLAKNAYSHNNADLFYQYKGRNFIFKTDLFFDRDVVHYYGFNPQLWRDSLQNVPSDDSIKQRYAFWGGKIGLGNNITQPTDFQYFANFGFDNISDRHRNHENHFSIDLSLRKQFRKGRFKGQQAMGANFGFQHYGIQSTRDSLVWQSADSLFVNTSKQLRNNAWQLNFLPFYALEWKEYSLRIGADFVLTGDGKRTLFHVHPDIEAKIKLIADRLDIFAGLGGQLERNSMKALTDENPFIEPSLAYSVGDEAFMNKKITIYGGINANILEGWDLKAGARYSYVDNMPFYTLVYPDAPFVVPTYQPIFATVNELNIFLTTRYSFTDRVGVRFDADYFAYGSKTLNHAYYKPNFKLCLSTTYRPIKPLQLSLDFRFYSKMWGFDGEEVQLPCLYDLNLGGEYNFWKSGYVFVQLSNIFAQNYARYLYYPTQGLTVMGGVKFRF